MFGRQRRVIKNRLFELEAEIYREPECGSHYQVTLEWGPLGFYTVSPTYECRRFIAHFHMELHPFSISWYDRINNVSKRKRQ